MGSGVSRSAELPLRASPANRPPPVEEERQIALLRLPFALPPLLVFIHGIGPVAHPRLAAAAAAGYALHALLSALLVLVASHPSPHQLVRTPTLSRRLTVAIDLLFATLLVYAIGTTALPPVLLSLHAVFSAALCWGPAGAAATALLGAGMGGLALWHTPAAGQIGFICLFLLCVALMGIRLGGIYGRRGCRALADERDRIARDLHDDFIQNLVAAGLRVELCRGLIEESGGDNLAPVDAELEALQQLLNRSLEQSREYIATMRPDERRGAGLAACLEQCLRDLFRGQPVEARVIAPPSEPRLSPEVETAAFYIAREALFNARKHASPQQVVVSLECRHDRVKVVVADDGRGFQPPVGEPAAVEGDLHRGLRTMRERAEALGGSLRLDSAPGRGTRVIVLLPTDAGR